jgi:hypothetical protein
VSDVTERAPSPLVTTAAEKLPSSVAPVGRLAMLGELGGARFTVKARGFDVDDWKFVSPW